MFFEERQTFLANRLVQALLVVLLGGIVAWGLWQRGMGGLSLSVLSAPVLVLGLLFAMQLRVVVRPGEVGVHLRPFPRKVIALDEIVDHAPRTYRPVLEYGGWGLRTGRHGWAYNVHGNRGVQLQLQNGQRILIGSQRPEELARAIAEAKAARA